MSDIPNYVLSRLGIDLNEYNVLIESGYYVEMTNIELNLYRDQPRYRIMMRSDIAHPSLTYTNHGTQDIDVTENVLKMISGLRAV